MQESMRLDMPEEIWEQIISLLDDDRYLEPLSLVSKSFLSITNRYKQTLIILNSTANFLPKLFVRFPNLKHISLSDFHGEPTSVLSLLSQTDFPLLSLDLSNHAQFYHGAIRKLPISSLRSIKSLKLHNIGCIVDFDLAVISVLMINLEELDVSGPKEGCNWVDDVDFPCGALGITDYGIDLIASRLAKLRKVNLSSNPYISNESVFSLAEKCPDLDEIVVNEHTFVSQEGVNFALLSCVNLRSVGLSRIDLAGPEINEALGFARNLSVLDFSSMSVSDELLFAIAKALIPLKKFTLSHCKDLTFSGVMSLLHIIQSLEFFALEGVHWVDDRSVIDISKFLQKANTVKLNYCSRLTSSGLFTLVKTCPLLNSLEMKKMDAGKEEFSVDKAYNPQVRALSLGQNKTLNDECLGKISRSCPNLELLDVSHCPSITPKGIGEIMRNCTSLRHLQLRGCGQIKSLGTELELCKLEVLRASGSGFDDEGLLVIAKKCPALTHLDVMGCSGLSYESVKEVKFHCRRLRKINMDWCGSWAMIL